MVKLCGQMGDVRFYGAVSPSGTTHMQDESVTVFVCLQDGIHAFSRQIFSDEDGGVHIGKFFDLG